ncbi:MAG: YceI family protein [Caulobacterales bacterium]|nr:YceI family protein [Caulobacterales bacterium]
MRTIVPAAAAALLAACATTPSTEPGAAPSGAYELDPNHTSVIWRLAHGGGLSMYTARFDTIAGALDFDPETPAASRVDITIDPKSANTGLPDFDEKIATSGDVLDADAHPEIRFTSTDIEVASQTTGRVTGDLTLRGRTYPVTLDVTYNGSAFDPLRGADVVGFSATGALTRSQFGADAWVNFGVGDEVELIIEAEFAKK